MGVSMPKYKSWEFAPPPDLLRSPMSDRLAFPATQDPTVAASAQPYQERARALVFVPQ
jgi:hypothetical protein